MTAHILSPDTQATLLLCGNFGKTDPTVALPLTTTEYSDLAQWLLSQNLRPANLLQPEGLAHLSAFAAAKITGERLAALLKRSGALALAVEDWTNKGLWVISRSDPQYPRHLKDKLKQAAPPILYGAGNHQLLNRGGLSIVGSRNVADTGLTFTREVAAICVNKQVQVISGGAKGVDTAAIVAALELGGTAVALLADSLARTAVSKTYRQHLQAGRLVLASPYYPEAGFNVGNAMGRNRYIYALSDAALVVDSGLSGGTWSGAIENLKRGWVPLLVRHGEDAGEGNLRLIELGGHPVTLADLIASADLIGWLRGLASATAEATPPAAGAQDGLFDLVWPRLADALVQPRTDRDLAQTLQLHLPQVQAWLARAVAEGKAKKLADSGEYVSVRSDVRQLSLFN